VCLELRSEIPISFVYKTVKTVKFLRVIAAHDLSRLPAVGRWVMRNIIFNNHFSRGRISVTPHVLSMYKLILIKHLFLIFRYASLTLSMIFSKSCQSFIYIIFSKRFHHFKNTRTYCYSGQRQPQRMNDRCRFYPFFFGKFTQAFFKRK